VPESAEDHTEPVLVYLFSNLAMGALHTTDAPLEIKKSSITALYCDQKLTTHGNIEVDRTIPAHNVLIEFPLKFVLLSKPKRSLL